VVVVVVVVVVLGCDVRVPAGMIVPCEGGVTGGGRRPVVVRLRSFFY
jgi:hypothetical protein